MKLSVGRRGDGRGTVTRTGASSLGVLVGLSVLAAAGLGWWYARERDRGAVNVDPDRVVRVERRDLIDGVTASGRVEPLARVAVMSRASGIIKELQVEEGDVVAAGQVLAELDREQLEAQRAQDVADHLAARARVDAARARLAEAELRVQDPEIEFLEREAARLQELFEQGDVSVRELEEAKRTLANARFRVDLVAAGLPTLRAAVAEAEADLQSAEAALERSLTALREATILSPIDGVVLVRDREVGDGVSSILTAGGNATQLMTLGDLSVMHVEARVDEVDLGRIHVGMPARVTVDAYRGRVLEGEVERIAPAGSVDDNGIVTFEVRVSVHDPDGVLKPDMTADAKLVVDRRDGVPTLPQIALRRGPDGTWCVDRVTGEGEAQRVVATPVELGLSDGLLTEITAGVGPDDRVLLED